jgi:hypothetical protein
VFGVAGRRAIDVFARQNMLTSCYKTDGIAQENQPLTFFNRSAKPPFVGSTPTRASNSFAVVQLARFFAVLSILSFLEIKL